MTRSATTATRALIAVVPVLLLLLGLAVAVQDADAERASGPTSRPLAPDGPLAPLIPLVGGAWVADFPNGLTDTQTFEPMVAGRFLRNVHWVATSDGRTVYEGETVYGAEPGGGGDGERGAGALRWWYFNSTGGSIVGELEVQADGSIEYSGDNHGGAGQTTAVRGAFRFDPDDPDVYTAVTYFERGGEWVVERELVYRREGETGG